LAEELKALRRSLPAHSLKPALLIHIEEMEEQIEALQHADKPYEAQDVRRSYIPRFMLCTPEMDI